MKTPLHRLAIHKFLLYLRQTRLRRPILVLLVSAHNTSYHWISFFASHSGLHPKHKILNYHQFFLDHVGPTDHVADLGCGRGEVAHDLAGKARRVTGIDSKTSSIVHARRTYRRNNLEFKIADITRLDGQRYDVAVLSNVLEHIADRPAMLRRLRPIVSKVLVRVPLITRDWVSVFKKNEGFEYRLDHTHFIEFTEEIFREETARADWKITHLHTKFGELYAILEKPRFSPSPRGS